MLSVKFNLTKKRGGIVHARSLKLNLACLSKAVLSSAQVVARAKGACRLGEKEEAARL